MRQQILDAIDVIAFFVFMTIVALNLGACGKAKDKEDPAAPTDQSRDVFNQAADRLVSMLDDGWVVSRTAGGDAEHKGDALIWSGVAMAALDCERGAVVEKAMFDMLDTDLDGAVGNLFRHPDLVDQVSMDGALGLYLGIASRLKRCPESSGAWAARFKPHAERVAEDSTLNARSEATIPPYFDYLTAAVAWRLGVGNEPSSGRLRALEQEVAGWALTVRAAKKPCFRIHLGYLSLAVAEGLGIEISAAGRNAFCANSAGTDLPLVDHWCGRGDLAAWTEAFTFNRYEYAHQRCPAWEAPDAGDLKTPGLDLLIAMREAYSI